MADRKYYSQYGEDLLLWALFKEQPTGFFIDIGAFDGVHISNSLSFEQQGWMGICVEAHPSYAPLCTAARPGSACLHAAAVGPEQSGRIAFQTEPLGLLSGIVTDPVARFAKRYARRGMTFPGFETVEVDALTIDEMLAKHPSPTDEIDFISIDTEGTELDVLRGFTGDARAFVVEANDPARASALIDDMAHRGFQPARSLGVNVIFAKPGRDFDVLAAAHVTGTTEITAHPMGALATVDGMVGKVLDLRPDG